MELTLAADPLPLSTDEHGRIRIAGKRVFLEIFINTLNQGLSPNEMIEHFDMLDPADIHAVLAYYIRHRAEVDEYVRRKNEAADEMRKKIERDMPPKVSHEELRARWAALKDSRDAQETIAPNFVIDPSTAFAKTEQENS